MNHAVVLGAGFSYAMSSKRMPLTDTLGNEITDRLRSEGSDVPALFSGGRFELWLSRLAEPQPYLDDVANARNHALFLRISVLVREVLLEAQNRALEEPLPWTFQRLIGMWHGKQSSVLTFNYDTLVERAIESQWRMDWEARRLVRGFHVIEDRPPTFSTGPFREGPASSFRLIKLHGSVDTFWVAGDSTGATINRLGGLTRWNPGADPSEVRRLRLPGRVPFIVPPAAAKSAFYANPLTRQLWRDASEALGSADRVDIVGYSLPATDLVTSAMLADALARNGSRIRVVNNDPDPVIAQLRNMGCEDARIQVFSGNDAIDRYADAIELECFPLERRRDEVARQLSQHALLMVGFNQNDGAAVSEIVRDPSDRSVVRVQTELLGQLAHVNRLRDPADNVASLADLLAGTPPRRILVDFPTGETAAVIDVTAWLESTGHHSNWLRLIPAAMPPAAPE